MWFGTSATLMAMNDNDGAGADHQDFRRTWLSCPESSPCKHPAIYDNYSQAGLYLTLFCLLSVRFTQAGILYQNRLTEELYAHTNHIANSIAILCLHTALPPCANKLTKLRELACFWITSSTCRPTYWLDLIRIMFRQVRISQVHLYRLPPQALSTSSHSSTHHDRAHRPRTTQHLQPWTWSWEV